MNKPAAMGLFFLATLGAIEKPGTDKQTTLDENAPCRHLKQPYLSPGNAAQVFSPLTQANSDETWQPNVDSRTKPSPVCGFSPNFLEQPLFPKLRLQLFFFPGLRGIALTITPPPWRKKKQLEIVVHRHP